MMSQMIDSIQEECLLLTQQINIKPRQINQFTKDQKFIKKFDKKQKQFQNTTLITQITIPKFLQNIEVFRLRSNIQFPRNTNQFPQLGCLNVDFHSYNYKINRIDRRSNLTTITYDPIDRPFTPVETLQSIMLNDDERLLQSFNLLNAKKLDKQKFNILTQQQLLDFQGSLDKPYLVIISKVEKDKITTLHRAFNDQYLACLGIDFEMLYHYGYETGAMPIPIFFNEDGYNSQNFNFFLRINAFNYNVSEKLMTNYKGEKFTVKVTYHNYHIQDQNQDYFEYQFLIWEVDKRWCSQWKVLENYKDYFNLKELPLTTSLNIPEPKVSEQKQRCGYKELG